MTVSFIILVCVRFPFPDVLFHCGWQFISFSMLFCLLAMSENFFSEQDAPWPFWDQQRYLCARSKFNNTTQLGFPSRLFQAILQRLNYRDHQSVIPTLKSPNWIPAYYRWSRTVRYTKALEGCGQSHLGLRYWQTVFWTFMGDFECLPAPKVSSGTCIQNGRAEFSANNKRYIVLAEWALKHSTRVLELHALPASLAQVQHQFFPTSIDWSLTRHRSVTCQRSQAENVKGGLVSSS